MMKCHSKKHYSVAGERDIPCRESKGQLTVLARLMKCHSSKFSSAPRKCSTFIEVDENFTDDRHFLLSFDYFRSFFAVFNVTIFDY